MINGLKKIWIIDKDAGFSVFDQTFEKISGELDSDLVGGFFTALMSFSQEIAQSPIQHLQLVKYRIYFHTMKRFMLVFATESEFKSESAKIVSNKIQNRFETKYPGVLEKEFNGDVSIFNTFASELEEEFGKPCLCHTEYTFKSPDIHQQYLASKIDWQVLKSQIEEHMKKIRPSCDSGITCSIHTKIHEKVEKQLKKTNFHKEKK